MIRYLRLTPGNSQLKGLNLMVNSIFKGSRFEDLWLDK
jgi:hypothetical protein